MIDQVAAGTGIDEEDEWIPLLRRHQSPPSPLRLVSNQRLIPVLLSTFSVLEILLTETPSPSSSLVVNSRLRNISVLGVRR